LAVPGAAMAGTAKMSARAAAKRVRIMADF
jgi:hypothetical protein